MTNGAFDAFGCFGKLPVSREFLVDRAADLTASGFDTWVSEGLAFARGPLGGRWKQLATGFPPYRYAWSTRDRKDRFLYGELIPSEDAAGRIHPFTVFGVVDRGLTSTSRATFPLELFMLGEELRRLHEDAGRAPAPDDVVRTVRGRRLLLSTEIGASHDAFLRIPGRDFWDRLAKEGTDVNPALGSTLQYQVLQALVETVTYLRGRKLADIRMAIRYPILRGSGADLEHSVAFWLALTSRLLGAPLEGLYCFWTSGLAGAASSPEAPASPDASGLPPWPASLLVAFSPPSTAQFSAVIDPDSNLETVSYLERPYGEPPETRVSAPLRAILEDPGATLADLLAWAQRGT